MLSPFTLPRAAFPVTCHPSLVVPYNVYGEPYRDLLALCQADAVLRSPLGCVHPGTVGRLRNGVVGESLESGSGI